MSNIYRDVTLNQVSEQDIGKTIRVAGWVENIRDHGGVSFIDLRDMYAVMQIVIRDGKLLEGIRKEQAITVEGLIEKRDEETYNPKIPTGTIELDAKEVTVLGLIENPSFISNYTGFKNLKILASIQNRINDEEIKEAIRKVGLDPDDTRTFKKYSLGMKQRLGIAAAIMEKPDIVILDEPINALDEAGAGLIKGILDELKANGSLIIIACHDTEELNYLSDEIYEIYEGQIVSKNGEKIEEAV